MDLGHHKPNRCHYPCYLISLHFDPFLRPARNSFEQLRPEADM